MLSSDHLQEKHASVSLLLQLSRHEQICRNIGATPGAILMLITMKYNEHTDFVSSERAGETLKNMEKCPNNVKCMAENGLLEPLLNHIDYGKPRSLMNVMHDFKFSSSVEAVRQTLFV